MKQRLFTISSLALLLTGCVQSPVFTSDDHSFIKSSYPIINVNNSVIEPSYQIDLTPGENTLEVTYLTYRYNYHCTFKWDVEANTVYEIVDQENRYPLTLYRWIRRNSFWAARLDPVDPVDCRTEPRK
jgi:hypothetical protein